MHAGGLKLFYDRRPRLSALLEYQSANYKTLVLEKANHIIGFFSFSWSNRLVDGQIKKVAYIGDFRILKRREVTIFWRKFYPEFLQFLKSNGIDYIFTAILSSNKLAIKNLVDSSKGFFYHPIATQKMINIVSRKSIPQKRLQVSRASQEDFEQIKNLLQTDQQKKLFGYRDSEELERRLSQWAQFSKQGFLVIKNNSNQVLSCCNPWSPSPIKKIKVQNIHPFLKWGFQILNKIGFQLPLENQDLEILYLTHLVADPEQTIAFIDFIFGDPAYKFHILSVAESHAKDLELIQRKYFTLTETVQLYEVSTSSHPSFSKNETLEFEMAVV